MKRCPNGVRQRLRAALGVACALALVGASAWSGLPSAAAAQDADLGGEPDVPPEPAPDDAASATGASATPLLPVTGAPPPALRARALDPSAPVAVLSPEPPPSTTIAGRSERRRDAGASAGADPASGAPRPAPRPLVTAAEVVAAIEARPPVYRAAFADPAAVDALVAALARDRVLARAARAARLDEDPRVRAELDAVLARAFERRALENEGEPAIDGAAARAFYDAHLPDYTRPEMIRVAAVVFADRPAAARALAELRAEARAARREARFRALATTRSIDGRLRRRRGDLGWVYAGGRADAALVTAVMSVPAGELAPEVLELGGRFHVLRVTERRPPEPVPFERARAAVLTRMREERRRGALDAIFARVAREQGLRLLGAGGQVVVEAR